MSTFASLLGFGAPELVFVLGVVVVAALAFLIVKAFIKGYSSDKK